MPPLDLTKRSVKGSPITATEYDTDVTAIETEVNLLQSSVATNASDISTLQSTFEVTITGTANGASAPSNPTIGDYWFEDDA